jgi:hypothetical protein
MADQKIKDRIQRYLATGTEIPDSLVEDLADQIHGRSQDDHEAHGGDQIRRVTVHKSKHSRGAGGTRVAPRTQPLREPKYFVIPTTEPEARTGAYFTIPYGGE